MRMLCEQGIPWCVMTAPSIPGLNSEEIPRLNEAAAAAGARVAGYTRVRWNGAIGQIFEDWIVKNFPDRDQNVLHLFSQFHQGSLNDSRFFSLMLFDCHISYMYCSLLHEEIGCALVCIPVTILFFLFLLM